MSTSVFLDLGPTTSVVEPPWRRPLQAFRLAGLMRGILQSPLPDSNRRPRPYRGNPPSHGSRQCPRNAEFPASAASRDADASPLKVPRGGGPRGNPSNRAYPLSSLAAAVAAASSGLSRIT